MRIKFNNFDTHKDLNNIIKVLGINFRKLAPDEDMIVRIIVSISLDCIGNINDEGILVIEDIKNNRILCNNKANINFISIRNAENEPPNYKLYSYVFNILKT